MNYTFDPPLATCRSALRVAILFLAVSATSASPAAGQRFSLFAGGVHARYADSVSGTAVTIAGGFSLASRDASGSAQASLTQFVTGEWASELSVDGFAVHPTQRPVIVGLSFGGRIADFEGGTWSGRGVVGPFVAKTFGPLLTSLGASFGGVRRVDESSFALGTGRFMMRYAAPSGVTVEGNLTATTADTIRHADATVGARFVWQGGSLAVVLSARAGDLSDDPWGHASLEAALTPQATFEATVGRYPRSLSGLTDGVFASAGIRLRVGRLPRSTTRASRDRPVIVESIGDGRVRISLRYGSRVQQLDIAGEWNGWTPEPLTRDGSGRWSIEVQLPPGVYKYSVVVDSTTWTVPDGAATVPDDFGGMVALFVVR